jgi:hypothetical protein
LRSELALLGDAVLLVFVHAGLLFCAAAGASTGPVRDGAPDR